MGVDRGGSWGLLRRNRELNLGSAKATVEVRRENGGGCRECREMMEGSS